MMQLIARLRTLTDILPSQINCPKAMHIQICAKGLFMPLGNGAALAVKPENADRFSTAVRASDCLKGGVVFRAFVGVARDT